MLTFKEYLLESIEVKPGNYVSIDCEAPVIPQSFLPKSGKQPTNEYHITLMYSENSDVDQSLISKVLMTAADNIPVKVVDAECFDSRTGGILQPDKKTLVLKLFSPVLNTIHDSLVSLGMEHSYPEYSAHITLAYDVDTQECVDCMYKLRDYLMYSPITLQAQGFNSSAIEKNWSDKL